MTEKPAFIPEILGFGWYDEANKMVSTQNHFVLKRRLKKDPDLVKIEGQFTINEVRRHLNSLRIMSKWAMGTFEVREGQKTFFIHLGQKMGLSQEEIDFLVKTRKDERYYDRTS